MTVTARQQQCRDKFRTLGYTVAGASALVGNFVQESSKDLPTAFRTANLDHGSQGLPQWRLARLTSYQNFVQRRHPEVLKPGMTLAQADKALWPWYGNMDEQVAFVDEELKTDYPDLYAKLRYYPAEEVATLAADVCWQYERPNKELSGIANRIAAAQALAADAIKTATPGSINHDAHVPTLTDHLHNTAMAHESQAAGGVATAGIASVGAIALFASNFLDVIPRWELITIVVLVAFGFACFMIALSMRQKADTIRNALPFVSNVPKPTDAAPAEVERDPIPQVQPSPGAPVSDPARHPPSVLDDPDVQKAIEDAVAKAIAKRDAPSPYIGSIGTIGQSGTSTALDPVKMMTEVVEKEPPKDTSGSTMFVGTGSGRTE